MPGEYVVFLSAKNSIFRKANNGDNIKKIMDGLQNAISTLGFDQVEPVFVISSNSIAIDAKLVQDWLGRKRNSDLIHMPEIQEEPRILFTTTILSKVREYDLVVCIYHDSLWEIFQQFFPHEKHPDNDDVLLTNLSASKEEEKILYCSS